MKVLHITPSFYPATYWGGPIYSVFGLCNALAMSPRITLRVLTTDAASPYCCDSVEVTSLPMRYPAGYDVYFYSRWFEDSVSPNMLIHLMPMIRWADVVHLTATYSSPTIPTLLICRLMGKPVVWSPRGALQRWERSTKPRTKKVWEFVCNAMISRERCIMHVTSEKEATDSRARIPNADSILIPNGVDIPRTLPNRKWMPEGRLRLLYLGRLHPIKGIENLLQAMILISDEAVSLVICGGGDHEYSRRLQSLVHQLGLEERVSFRGHVEDNEKMLAFMLADVCVVPSFTENFGMVVAEALAHGVPVIAGKGTPWAELEKHKCGLWVDNAPNLLANAITFMSKADLAGMGSRGRQWMSQSFSWDILAARMDTVYRRLAGTTPEM